MVAGAFSPDRETIRASLAPEGEAPASFSDATPKEKSSFCSLDQSATRGLYERIAPGRSLVFRNARILTMQGDEALVQHDVVVRDSMIEAVKPTGSALPADAIVVDADGRTLLPGLSDIHSHLLVTTWAAAFAPMVANGGDGSQYVLPYDLQLFLQLANGITRIEIMAGCPDALWMRDAVRAGDLVGPKLSVGSPLIDGAPAIHSPTMSYLIGDREGGRRAGEQLADMGFDFAKPYSNLPAEGFEGLIEACQRRGVRLMGHVPSAVGVEAAVRRGQQGIAHSAELFYNERGPERRDPGRRERLARLMADSGTWLQATVVVSDRIEWIGGSRPLRAPDRQWMNPMHRALFAESSPMITMFRTNSDKQYLYDDTFNLSCLNTSAAREAGVRVLTGTDFPNPYVVDGFSLHEELQHLVEQCGFTPRQALYASTRRAAEYHDEGPTDGTVSAGARADLVLLDGDPLVDITNTRQIHAVLAGSALLRRSAIDEGLARVRKAYDSMPPVTVQMPQHHEYMTETDSKGQ
ncbi:MAG TPA: amidohydrolase family protein [Steroidobacteraceae bacterium]|nr:amidohydrolase family protein [Steroidobacteraceae bacterium]